MDQTQRLNIRELKAEQIQPLEGSMPQGWPDTWRELALSVYVTLLSQPAWAGFKPEVLAMQVAAGIGQDMGGTQPYIPVGYRPSADERRLMALQMLAAGDGYRKIASALGLTESRVRKIESEDRRDRKKAASKYPGK